MFDFAKAKGWDQIIINNNGQKNIDVENPITDIETDHSNNCSNKNDYFVC